MGLPKLRYRHDPSAVPTDAEDGPVAVPDVSSSRRFWTRRRQPPEARILWQNGHALATRLVHVALVGALISGPVALIWVAVSRTTQPPAPMASVEESAGSQTRNETLAAAAAQRLVLTWLTASATDKAALQALLVDQLPATVALPEKRPAAPGQVWIGEVDQRAPGRYRVVVATVGGSPGGHAYFAVPVAIDDGVAAALSLPARTRPPDALDHDNAHLRSLSPVSTDDPAFQTAAGYITAYLTASGELDRWTAPDAPLDAIAPAACSAVRVNDVETLASEHPTSRISVIATATCQTRGRPPTTTQHGLVLQTRDGRWEVLAEDPALLLDPAAATTEAPPSTAPPDAATAAPNPSTPR
jgi:hypothetical protein